MGPQLPVFDGRASRNHTQPSQRNHGPRKETRRFLSHVSLLSSTGRTLAHAHHTTARQRIARRRRLRLACACTRHRRHAMPPAVAPSAGPLAILSRASSLLFTLSAPLGILSSSDV